MHQVSGDRIIETTTGKEVIWRGAGGSYTLNAATLGDSLNAWANMYIPTALAGALDTMRLSFRFAWDGDPTGTLVLDFAKMDAIIDLLASNGIKAILDQHGSYVPIPSLMPQLATSWQEVATHYKANSNVLAYEIANEPAIGSSGYTRMDNAQGYHDITLAIREIDPDKICIWESPDYYVPPFAEMESLLLPNVVYTEHKWWTYGPPNPITVYGAHELSLREFQKFLYDRATFNIPFWLGEFGGPNGGNPQYPYTYDDIWWAICQELLSRAEEQVVGWNLWMGLTTPAQNRLAPYIPSLVPNNYTRNVSLIRQPWYGASAKLLRAYIVAENMDSIYDYVAQAYHGTVTNPDFITLSPGITVKVTHTHVTPLNPDGSCPIGTYKNTAGTACLQDFVETFTLTSETTFTNIEGTTEFPGDWNLTVESVAPITRNYLFGHWQDGDLNPSKRVTL